MCLAIPGKVVSVEGKKAIIDYGREKQEAVITLPVFAGEYVLVQMGCVVEKVASEDVSVLLESWKKPLQN